MQVAFKNLITAAAFLVAAGASHAATVTVTAGSTVYKGHTAAGSEVLTLSDDAVGMLNALKIAVTPGEAPASITQTNDADGKLLSLSAAMPLASLKLNDVTDDILDVIATGGLVESIPAQRGVSNGGAIGLSDFDIDLVNKKVFVKLSGTNGVGTLTHFPLWNIASVAGSTNFTTMPNGDAVIQLVVSGLSLAPEAVDTVSKALGLQSVGKALMTSLTDYGTLAVGLTSTQTVAPCTVSFKTTRPTSTPTILTTVTINNATSNAATDWKVGWNYDKATILSSIQNTTVANLGGFKSYQAVPVASNKTVAANSAATFSFKGSFSGAASPVLRDLTATLGGVSCPVTQAP